MIFCAGAYYRDLPPSGRINLRDHDPAVSQALLPALFCGVDSVYLFHHRVQISRGGAACKHTGQPCVGVHFDFLVRRSHFLGAATVEQLRRALTAVAGHITNVPGKHCRGVIVCVMSLYPG